MIHLAAFTNVRDSVRHPIKCFIDNCYGTINCLELAKDLKINHFIFASSGGASLSQSPYSASKLAGEAICKAYRESYDLDISIIRFSNVYGPYSLHKHSIIPKFIKLILKKEPLQVFGDGEQTRDFIFVDDVISSLTTTHKKSDVSASFGHSITINHLISILSAISERTMNYVPEVTYLPPKKGEVLKVKGKSGIKPLVSLEEGLEKTFEWFRDNYSG
jgi:UDP-glucose 4-epimerase